MTTRAESEGATVAATPPALPVTTDGCRTRSTAPSPTSTPSTGRPPSKRHAPSASTCLRPGSPATTTPVGGVRPPIHLDARAGRPDRRRSHNRPGSHVPTLDHRRRLLEKLGAAMMFSPRRHLVAVGKAETRANHAGGAGAEERKGGEREIRVAGRSAEGPAGEGRGRRTKVRTGRRAKAWVASPCRRPSR